MAQLMGSMILRTTPDHPLYQAFFNDPNGDVFLDVMSMFTSMSSLAYVVTDANLAGQVRRVVNLLGDATVDTIPAQTAHGVTLPAGPQPEDEVQGSLTFVRVL